MPGYLDDFLERDRAKWLWKLAVLGSVGHGPDDVITLGVTVIMIVYDCYDHVDPEDETTALYFIITVTAIRCK